MYFALKVLVYTVVLSSQVEVQQDLQMAFTAFYMEMLLSCVEWKDILICTIELFLCVLNYRCYIETKFSALTV